VLTSTYHAIYGAGAGEDGEELILVVAPLAANKEIMDLYNSGILDYETAMPAALHSVGCSAEEISSAMQRRREREAKETSMNEEREKTERAELKARSKVAANPLLAQSAAATGGSSGGAASSSAPRAAATKPSKSTKP